MWGLGGHGLGVEVWGSGFCYGLMIRSEGLVRGIKVMAVIRGRYALVYDVRAVEQADNPLT